MKLRPLLGLFASCLVITSAFVSVVRADAPTSTLQKSLDGTWAFTINESDLQKDSATWDHLPVPGNWDVVNEYSHHRGKGWYRRTFTMPSEMKGKHLWLHFDAVYETAEVTLNGKVLGKHEGGYTPFEFEVTDGVKWEGENVVTVCADSTYHRGAWWAWGGISRSVNLVANEDVRILWQHVRTELDLKTKSARVHVELQLENSGRTDALIDLRSTIEGLQLAQTARLNLPAGQVHAHELVFDLLTEQVKLWDLNHPNLYKMVTTLSSTKQLLHSKSARFGIRKIEVTKDSLLLNGEPIRVNGFNRVHDHRAYGNSEPEHLIRLDVDMMKSMGANMMRIMHAPQATNLLDYLDEKGMLIMCEVPVWGAEDPNMTPGNPRVKQWLREMVDRDFNHPCIIGWSVGNELLKHDAYVKSMIEYGRKELDPHRTWGSVSFSGARKEYGPTNDPISACDFIWYNTYGSATGAAEVLHQKWPDKPIFFTEFGTKQFGESLDSKIPHLEEMWTKMMKDHPYVIGGSLWTFNDYRSDYKGSTPGELRSWGVVNLWRQKKAACEQIENMFSPVKSLSTADGGPIRLVPRGKDECSAFALRDYKLKWEYLRDDGTVAGGGVMKLMVIYPGDQRYDWPISSPPHDASNLVVSLINPTGYIVNEWWQIPSPPPKPEPKATLTSAPIVYQAEPVDGGFMLGYSTEKEDKGFIVEYGTESGKYTQKQEVKTPGATMVRGLKNGQEYFARLKRVTDKGESEWSSEVKVMPDGGLKPAAPKLLGVVRGKGIAALRFEDVPKAIGYRVKFGDKIAEINAAAPGGAVIEGLDDEKAYTFTVSAINANGESEPSNAVEMK